MKRKKQTCRNCRNWYNPEDSKIPYGICQGIPEDWDKDPEGKETAYITDGDFCYASPYLMTKPEFYCFYWKQRKETE